MPSGLTGGWVDAPPDLPEYGALQWEDAGVGSARAQVGGAEFADVGQNPALSQTGFNRIATGIDLGEPVPGEASAKMTDWRALFNYQHNPTFWILLFALVAVGFIHARLQVGGNFGRLRGSGGLGV